MRFAWVVLFAAAASGAQFDFHADRQAEYVATLRMSAPGTSWDRTGHEAALARVRVDAKGEFHVMLYAGETEHDYPVFLGPLAAGDHSISVETEPKWSAPGAQVDVRSFSARPAPDDEVIARAPVLFARENTIGLFTDVPMVVYAERDAGSLTYTVIFSNEDGGTSTRALMARWGRTTDVEYIYRLDRATAKAIIQTRNHEDIPFNGTYEGLHPLLIPITNNNMVSGEGRSPIRYQIAPVLVDLSGHSREQVMNDRPFTYRIMAQELVRENKIRPYDTVNGNRVSDPRNYLYLEMKVANHDSALAVQVRLDGENVWRSGDLGRSDYGIERDGWVQTAIELPPGTPASRIAEIGLACVLPLDPKTEPKRTFYMSGECRVDAVGKVFQLSGEYVPGPSVWSLSQPVVIPSGRTVAYRIR